MAKQELRAIISADARAFNRTMNKVGKTALNVGKALSASAIAGGIFAVREAAQFSKQMAEVNTMANLTPEALAKMKQEALALSSEIGVSLDDVTKALYQAVSAGVPPDNAISFLKESAKGAIGGVTELTTAVDGITSVLNAYKMKTSEAGAVNDIFFETVKRGKTTYAEMSANIGKVAPIANSLKIGFAELGASFTTLTSQGINTAESATQVKGVMAALIKPSDALRVRLAQVAKQQGVASWESLGFTKTLDLLSQSCGGNVQKLGLLFPSVEALNGVLGLTGTNAAKAATDLLAMKNSAGSANAAFSTMMQNESKQFEIAQATIHNTAVVIGTELIPVVAGIAGDFAAWLKEGDNLKSMEETALSVAEAIKMIATASSWVFEKLSALSKLLMGFKDYLYDPHASDKDIKDVNGNLNAGELARATIGSPIGLQTGENARNLKKHEVFMGQSADMEIAARRNLSGTVIGAMKRTDSDMQSLLLEEMKRIRELQEQRLPAANR